MFTNAILASLVLSIAAMLFFLARSLLYGKPRLIHKLYAAFSCTLILWMLAIIVMHFTPEEDRAALYFLDAITNISVPFAPTLVLLIAIVFTKNLDTLPRKYYALYAGAAVVPVVVFTNPLHHLHYRVFSIHASEVVFGPFLMVSGAYSYVCMICATFLMLRFAVKNPAYVMQVMIYCLGILVPFATSVLATLKIIEMSIAATPLAFVATVVCHGVAINYMGLLDIKPIALQKIVDSISDGYLIIDDNGRVVGMNKPFEAIFGRMYGIKLNRRLEDIRIDQNDERRGGIYNLLTSIESCRQMKSMISYEQPVLLDKAMIYYIVEITPLVVNAQAGGFVALFKDVTKIRENVRREQVIQSRTMERERLASLGQMIGGISHNLKTPIMSVAGSVGMLEKLNEEYAASIGDNEVTDADHKEISAEMAEWHKKIRDCCAYMSDIITTVKGLATNMNASGSAEFTLDEVFKRVLLLTQHDLVRNNCSLSVDHEAAEKIVLNGDINNLVQVLSNLVGNAIDAMKVAGGGDIELNAKRMGDVYDIIVRDHGTGIMPDIKEKLFREMVTSKGAMGTGLGLYTSGAIIRGKFAGNIWFEDNPEGGTTFHITIPVEHDDSILLQEREESMPHAQK